MVWKPGRKETLSSGSAESTAINIEVYGFIMMVREPSKIVIWQTTKKVYVSSRWGARYPTMATPNR